MDAITSLALEEICSSGPAGLALLILWEKLLPSLISAGLDLSAGVKNAVWSNLLKVRGLKFRSKYQNSFYDPTSDAIRLVEYAERLELEIVAADHLRDCFVGLYDLPVREGFKGFSALHRRTLERLAIARQNGVTQSQLCKEFGKQGNEIFYVVRSLETQGLIVRQPTIVWKKLPSGQGEQENRATSATNMLYLYRYAKHLGSQQRLEVIKEDKTSESPNSVNEFASNGDGTAEECVKEDILVKDYLPAMKAVCDRLEEADGKVLAVKDIKQDLGYRHSSGHRAWRNICHRLKDACLLEEMTAKVNNKVVPCLRLCGNYSPKKFEAMALRSGKNGFNAEQVLSIAKRGQTTDQVVELPIEHQIYDMIDAEGSKGLTIIEICKRLGISNKKYYSRFCSMFSRYGMHLREQGHKRGSTYRVWTSRNFCQSENVSSENDVSNLHVKGSVGHDNLALTITEFGSSASPVDVIPFRIDVNSETEQEPYPEMVAGACNDTPLSPSMPQEDLIPTMREIGPDEPDLVNPTVQSCSTSEKTFSHAFLLPPKPQTYEKDSSLTLNRERRILERLQRENFIIRAELQKWLQSFEKDKCTDMDRKTLIRILNRLQQRGLCKCVKVSVPVIANCGRSRIKEVVLHPSVQNMPSELLGQINEKNRIFETQIRGQALSQSSNDPSIPILDGIQQTGKTKVTNSQAATANAMRSNGFVLARMVRAKLLHMFLWDHLIGSAGCDDVSAVQPGYDMKNPHSTCKLFALDAAIKAIPIELFLQVVGCPEELDDIINKCRSGLRLSDFPLHEYRFLMDTRATGRLSKVIDILRRLKLIRLVTEGILEDGTNVHATYRDAIELKPYIEEPVSITGPSSYFVSDDLRPHIRHDFLFLNKETVNDYWRTLEFCYSTADPAAALHAFPGSYAHELVMHRSWTSVRVMTADQRSKLLQRIMMDEPNKKISFAECRKIASDLNLTLQQVLRAYYDKQHKRPNSYSKLLDVEVGNQSLASELKSSSRKKRRAPEALSNHFDAIAGKLHKQDFPRLSDNIYHFSEQHILPTSPKEDIQLQPYLEYDPLETRDAIDLNEDEQFPSFFRHAYSGLKPSCQRRFLWTEHADRLLVMLYARHRATLGAKFHRVDWALLPDLPASPSRCRKRMAFLNRDIKLRKAIMELCNILSERYAKHLDKSKNRLLNDNNRMLMAGDFQGEQKNHTILDGQKYSESSDCQDERWDDFDNEIIKAALNEVLLHKRMIKLDPSKKRYSLPHDVSSMNLDSERHDCQESDLVVSTAPSEYVEDCGRLQHKITDQRSICNHLPQKFIKLLNGIKSTISKAYESLAVSSAIELLKLVFLSTSTAEEMPILLAKTLRRYSEHDLFAAFSYLREKKIMIGGTGGNSFALSQCFLRSISSSPFPTDAGKRAAKFASWLHEKENNLMEEAVSLTADLDCGDIYHLFALVSLGELSLIPCLPDEGVGEAEDLRIGKRKLDDPELSTGGKTKKQRSLQAIEGELISRREKGFPGIMVSLSHGTFARANPTAVFKDARHADPDINYSSSSTFDQRIDCRSSHSDNLMKNPDVNSLVSEAGISNDSSWEAMTRHAEYLTSILSDKKQENLFHPGLFKTVFTAIQKAGDQGLTMAQVSQVMDVQGEEISELVVEVLQSFGRALKVNSYDAVHVVDALYKSKYCLISVNSFCRRPKTTPFMNSHCITGFERIDRAASHETDDACYQREINMTFNNVHKVTILNLPERASHFSDNNQPCSELEGYIEDSLHFSGGGQGKESLELSSAEFVSFVPILPWINGDGTINSIVYRGLLRRVLGVVMQNPGLLEADIVRRITALNPQSCRELLKLMVLDKHLIIRKMHQTVFSGPPAIFGSLFSYNPRVEKSVYREHFFANPLSTALL